MRRKVRGHTGWYRAAVIAGIALLAICIFPGRADAETMEIRNAADLAKIGREWPLNGTYELKDDIDLTNYDSGDGLGWNPVEFLGTLEGNHHVIRGLKINRSGTDSVGLFKELGTPGNPAVIRNLTFENVDVSGKNAVGTLAGYLFAGTVENVKVLSGTVTAGGSDAGGIVGRSYGEIRNSSSAAHVNGGQNSGGLVGYGYSGGSVTNSSASGNVEGTGYVGGLIGKNDGVVDGSYASGDVTATEEYAGGLIGSSSKSISNSYATGYVRSTANRVGGLVGFLESGVEIRNSYAEGDVTGANYTGGLVGHASNVKIINSFSLGQVTGVNQVGGLLGYGSSAVTLENTYARGGVSGNDYVGGLIGYANTLQLSVTASASFGDISGTGTYLGGLVGKFNNGTITLSYAVGNVTGTGLVGGLVGSAGTSGNIASLSDSFALGHVNGDQTVGGLVGSCYTHVTRAFAMGDVNARNFGGGICGDKHSSANVTNAYYSGNVTSSDFMNTSGTKLTAEEMAQPDKLVGFSFASHDDLAKTWVMPPGGAHPLIINPGIVTTVDLNQPILGEYNYGDSLEFDVEISLSSALTEPDAAGRLKPLYVSVKITDDSGDELFVQPLLENAAEPDHFQISVDIDDRFPGNGAYRYELWAVTARGGTNVVSGSFDVKGIFVAAKKADQTDYRQGEWSSQPVTLTALFADGGTLEYVTRSSAVDDPSQLDGWLAYSGPVNISASGETHVYFKGQASSETFYRHFPVLIDSLPPEEPVIALSGAAGKDGWHRSEVEATITGDDEHSGVDRIEYSIDGVSWLAYDDADPPVFDTDGTWTLWARVYDKAGNFSETSREVKVDLTAPEAPELTLSGVNGKDGWANGTVTVTIRVDAEADGLSGVDETWYKVEKTGETATWQMQSGAYNGTVDIEEDGVYTVSAYVKDKAGNESPVAQVVVKVDTIKPSLPQIGLSGTRGDDGWFIGEVTVTIDVYDPWGEIDFIEYFADDRWKTYTAPFEIGVEGEHFIKARAIDKAGNMSLEATQMVKVDMTPPNAPDIRLSGPINIYGWASGKVTVTVTEATYTVGGVAYNEYKIGEDGTWTKYVAPFEIEEEGIHQVYARTIDLAGHTGVTSVKEVKIDLSKPDLPVIELTGPFGKDGWARDTVTAVISHGADHGSGPDYTQYRLGDTGDWMTYNGALEFDEEGTYPLYARTVDKAGNTGAESSAVIKVDRTPPDAPALVLTGPGNPIGPNRWSNGPVRVELVESADLQSGTDYSEYKINDGPWNRYAGAFEISDGYETKVYARTVDKAGNVGGDVSVTVVIESNRPAPPPGPIIPPLPVEPIEVPDEEDPADGTLEEADGRTVYTVPVDSEEVRRQLEDAGEGAVVTITVAEETDAAAVELNGEIVREMQLLQASIEMNVGYASYLIPAELLQLEEMLTWFGEEADFEEMTVRIGIAQSSEEEAVFVEDVAAGAGITVVVPPVHFSVEIEYAGRTVELNRFSAYVERRIAIPDGTDPGRITTAAVVEPDGTIRPVPTRIEFVDGKYYAVIRSMTNSLYALVGKTAAFADVENHWSKDVVNDMASRLVVNGRSNGHYEPDRPITRAEFAAVLVRGLGLKPDDRPVTFTDVSAADWYYREVQTAYQYGIVQGYTDGTFRPMERITREQAVAMLSRATALAGITSRRTDSPAEALRPFADADQVSAWAVPAMADGVDAGLITGRNGQRLAPKEWLTRAETAVLVHRLLQRSGLI